MSAPATLAAENVVFVSGAFRRSIPVSDLEHLASTGQARGLLADVMRFGGQKPAEVAKLLNASLNLPVVTVSRLLNTSIGERILERLSSIVFPLNARSVGLPALRSAVVLGIADNKGSLSALSFLRSYPSQELAVSLPALLALMQKASSVADLVRFFSESPLDIRSDSVSKGSEGAGKPATP
ncbi:MAG: alpha/beta hydrolase [Cyanobium sp.]